MTSVPLAASLAFQLELDDTAKAAGRRRAGARFRIAAGGAEFTACARRDLGGWMGVL